MERHHDIADCEVLAGSMQAHLQTSNHVVCFTLEASE